MTITDEMKTAFRTAYDFLEKHEVPTGDSNDQEIAFGDMAQQMTLLVTQTTGDKSLTAHLLIGAYDYLAEQARKYLV
mgnify:CR=1 FL=1